MPFTPVTYNTGAAPGLDGPAFNTMQLQFAAAVNAFERDLLTPFVFSGFVATKDGTTASQLDVTAGVAFLRQSASQNEVYRVAPTSSTQSTTGHPSTTLYLDLNPDGSWSWGTAHSATANYLSIASVTTDSSANIATVTDARPLNTTLLSGMAGVVQLGKLSTDGGAITSNGTGTLTVGTLTATNVIQGAGILIDIEGGITVIRSEPTGDPIAIQVNGVNTYFNTNGTVTLGSGGTAAGISTAGGGNAGYHVWVGTTDPGASAQEGDIWIGG